MNDEIINKCLRLAYSADGIPEMGELAAQSHGLELEYERALRRIKIDAYVIIDALIKTGYYDGKTGAYQQFNIKIGKSKNDIYDGRIEFILPYAVLSFLNNEPLELHFVPHIDTYAVTITNRKPSDSYPIQLKIATTLKKIIDSRFVDIAGLQTFALKIIHSLGETIVNK